MWQEHLDWLAGAAYRVIAVDLPGIGEAIVGGAAQAPWEDVLQTLSKGSSLPHVCRGFLRMRAPPVGPIERVGGPLPGLDLSATLTATRRRLTGAVAHGFPAVDPAAEIDPLEAEFRLHSVTAGAVVTLIVCIPALFYVMTSARESGKILLLAAWATALVGAVIALVLPWEGIIRSAWREPVFLIWTLLDLCLIGLTVVADGGPSSPITVLFFVPIVFVGASYPTWSVKLVSFLALAGYAGLAVAYHEPLGAAVLVLGGLESTALMSWWQAHNHERRRCELARASVTDPLTGALNRRGLDAAAAAELAAVDRFGRPVALMIIDLDNFKTYNDTYGHIAGDELLAWTADRIRIALRPSDALCRVGGDEFAVLVANADVSAAEPLVHRIQAACSHRAPHCTGIASAPADGHDFDSLYRASDRALYQAKGQRQPAPLAAGAAVAAPHQAPGPPHVEVRRYRYMTHNGSRAAGGDAARIHRVG